LSKKKFSQTQLALQYRVYLNAKRVLKVTLRKSSPAEVRIEKKNWGFEVILGARETQMSKKHSLEFLSRKRWSLFFYAVCNIYS
jgi:hypothetical protein